MIPVSEALQNVMNGVSTLAAERVQISDALGRVLAEDVVSRVSHPPAAVSSMDGYAVISADTSGTPVSLKLVGESAAGGGFDGTVKMGETVRIFTGAPLPDGADAVVMQENTDTEGTDVIIKEGVDTGNFIRPAGMDFAVGDVLLNAGTVLNARHIALAAAMNAPWMNVVRKPRIAILATGDELVMPGESMGPSQIVSSNSFLLEKYVESLGGKAVSLLIAGDTESALKSALEGARGCDMLITIGGASVGDYDLVGRVLEDLGLELIFHKVAQRPGKPLLFGKLGESFSGMPVMGMPGNPVSTGVCSMLYLKPAMMKMLGIDQADPTRQTAKLGVDVRENDQRQDYLRASLDIDETGESVATPFSKQDSALLARFAAADCLIIRAPLAPAAKAGDRVEIVSLAGSIFST